MKTMYLAALAAAMAVAAAGSAAAQTNAARTVTKETLTVAQPGAAGGAQVMTKEVVTVAPEKPAAPRPDVAADNSARKARVVVVPAVYGKEARSKLQRELADKWGITDTGAVENPGYTGFLVDALVNSRKLDVLEREDLKPAVKELQFGESDYADVARVVKLGQMLNADYVVIPEIRYLSVALEEKTIPYVDEKEKAVKGKLATSVRTVSVATSRIVASNIGDVEKKTRFKDSKGPVDQQVRDFIKDLYTESGMKETANIIDTAYPIKIVGVGDGICTINRGKGAIEVGEALIVYQPGEVMTDPDTKESLGYHEALAGKVKVVEVDEKTAKAQIEEGAGKIEKSFICRRPKPAAAQPPAAQPPAAKLD